MDWRQTAFCLQTSLIIYFEVHYLLLIFTKTNIPGLKRLLNIAVVLVCLAACIFSVRTIVRALWTVSFHIPSDSMEPTILPGDYICAWRLKDNAPIGHNDVIFFSFPYEGAWDSICSPLGRYYVKRCIALPGDTLRIEKGRFSVNGFYGVLGNVEAQNDLAARLAGVTEDSVARRMGICLDAWPQNDSLSWTVLDFGPLFVPCSGSRVAMDRSSFQVYRNYIEWEQGLPLTVDEKGVVSLGDSPIDSYTFHKDYYFVAGDKADNSRDSRYWGLLPRDHIAAKAWIIKKSVDPVSGKWRYGRIGKKVE